MSDIAIEWAARQQVEDQDKRRILDWLAERHAVGEPLRVFLPGMGNALGVTSVTIWAALVAFMHGGLIRVPCGIGEFATLELVLPELDEGGDE